MNYLTTFDVNEKIEVLQKISSEEWNGYRSKLEIPGINLSSGATGETERNDMGASTYHGRTIGCEKANSIIGGSSGPRKHRYRGSRVP